jgi:hypothetical protein
MFMQGPAVNASYARHWVFVCFVAHEGDAVNTHRLSLRLRLRQPEVHDVVALLRVLRGSRLLTAAAALLLQQVRLTTNHIATCSTS